jgi:hypothetical protein
MGAMVVRLRDNVRLGYLNSPSSITPNHTYPKRGQNMSRIYRGFTLLLLLTPTMPLTSAAQAAATGQQGRVPVTIVVTDRVPSDSRFAVQRIPDAARRDRILLRSDARSEDLMAAINTLLSARRIEGDVPPVERTMRIRPTSTRNIRRAPYPWISRILTDLRQTPEKDVPGIGRARAIQIWLPSQAIDEKSPPGPRGQASLRHGM